MEKSQPIKKDEQETCFDFSNANLRGATFNFEGLDLSNAQFHFSGFDIKHARISHVNQELKKNNLNRGKND